MVVEQAAAHKRIVFINVTGADLTKLPMFIIWLVICGAIALGIMAVADVSFLTAFAVAVLALMVNGVVAEIEDRAPGGFLNSDGTNTPRWLSVGSVVARSIGGVIVLATGIALFVMLPPQASPINTWVLRGSFLATSSLLALMLLYRKRARMLLWIAVVVLIIGVSFAFVVR